MAVLKDLIVHGNSRFINGINANSIKADEGIFNQLIAVDLKATDATIDNLTATNARVTQTLTANHISTNTWEAANIANVGGNFYISPTGEQSGTINVTITRTAVPGTDGGTYTLTFGVPSGVSGGFGVNSTSAAYWGANARVMATGEVSYNNSKRYPLGTCEGAVSGNVTASNNNITAITIAGVKSEALDVLFTDMGIAITASSGSLAGCVGYKLRISLYERYSNPNYYPIGILLTSLGKNKQQYIDIYSGTNSAGSSYTGFADPAVRIGQLDDLPALYTGEVPSGWGIYTTNGYFKGKIVATLGKIGNGAAAWTIGNDGDNRAYIYSGITNITSSGSTTGTYVGTNGISNYASTTQYVNLTGGKITAQGADIAGKITATSGSIGGWNIGTDTNKSLYYGNQTPGATTTNLVLSPTSATNSNAIGGSGTGLTWFISAGKVFGVTTAGALYSTSGKIGGYTIDDTSLYSGTKGNSTTSGHFTLTTGTFTRSIDGTSRSNLQIALGAKFGVANDGTLYANGANITSISADNISTGTLNAARIGATSITAGKLNVSTLSSITADMGTLTAGKITTNSSRTAYTGTQTGLTLDMNGIGAGNGSANTFKVVASTGVLTAVGAILKSVTLQDSSSNTKAIVDGSGLTIYDGGTAAANKAAIFGSTATIGFTSGNKYNVFIDSNAINLRYNTNILNKITATGMELFLSTDQNKSIAKFGSTTRIGKLNADTPNIQIDNDGFHLYNNTDLVGTLYQERDFKPYSRYGNNTSIDAFWIKTENYLGIQVGHYGGTGDDIERAPQIQINCLPTTSWDEILLNYENSITFRFGAIPVDYNDGTQVVETCIESQAVMTLEQINNGSTSANGAVRCSLLNEIDEEDSNHSHSSWYTAYSGSSSCSMGIGTGGKNRGLFDNTVSSWIIYRDEDHQTIINGSDGIRVNNSCVFAGGIRPTSASVGPCGTVDYPWSQVVVGSGNYIRTTAPDAAGQTYDAIWHKTTSNNYTLVRPSSSRKFKKDIEDISDPYLDPHKLYDLRVVQFRYKEKNKDDPNNSKWNPTSIIPGFIAEEVAEVYPVGGVINENDEIDDWMPRNIIPPMLKLIQEQKQEIEQLKKEVEELKKK